VSFPCVDAHSKRESRIRAAVQPAPSASPSAESGPEPPYARPSPSSYKVYHHAAPLALTYGETLPSFDVAYETWGTLAPARDNVILLHTGLSASSHAAATAANPAPGWWEQFIGPGKALDTDTFFVVCTNVLGGCYGSTGPSARDPRTGAPYATTFPIVSVFDMVRAQFCLLDHLGVDRLYASVGSSMGGMQSLAAGWLHPERVGKVVSISGTARTSPSGMAMRFAQRSGAARWLLLAPPLTSHRSADGGPELEQGLLLRRPAATYWHEARTTWVWLTDACHAAADPAFRDRHHHIPLRPGMGPAVRPQDAARARPGPRRDPASGAVPGLPDRDVPRPPGTFYHPPHRTG
jgi:pimeloyl-ACP methyl ester carboxylesterase